MPSVAALPPSFFEGSHSRRCPHGLRPAPRSKFCHLYIHIRVVIVAPATPCLVAYQPHSSQTVIKLHVAIKIHDRIPDFDSISGITCSPFPCAQALWLLFCFTEFIITFHIDLPGLTVALQRLRSLHSPKFSANEVEQGSIHSPHGQSHLLLQCQSLWIPLNQIYHFYSFQI